MNGVKGTCSRWYAECTSLRSANFVSNGRLEKPATYLVSIVKNQIDWLAKTDLLDGFLFETQPAPEVTSLLAREVRIRTNATSVIASFVFENFNSRPLCDGRDAINVAARVEMEKEVYAAIGVNCGVGMDLDAILDPRRGRIFDASERARIREMIAQGYAARSFSDLIIESGRDGFAETLVTLARGCRISFERAKR